MLIFINDLRYEHEKFYTGIIAICRESGLCARAKKIEIRGKIFNSVTDTLLEGVSVSADNMTKSELTDNRGEFVLSVNEIPHHIIVKYPGFHEEQILLYGRTSLSIYLIPLTIKGYPGRNSITVKEKTECRKDRNFFCCQCG